MAIPRVRAIVYPPSTATSQWAKFFGNGLNVVIITTSFVQVNSYIHKSNYA